MCSVHKKEMPVMKSEGGFVLIVALMGIMIILAVGYFALTVSTSDLRIAARLVGERKAFSAAESGVHALCQNLNPKNPVSQSATSVDSTNDPTAKYSYAKPERSKDAPDVIVPGYDLTLSYKGAHFDTIVTGEDTSYGSKVEIAVGTASVPNPSDTQQGPN